MWTFNMDNSDGIQVLRKTVVEFMYNMFLKLVRISQISPLLSSPSPKPCPPRPNPNPKPKEVKNPKSNWDWG